MSEKIEPVAVGYVFPNSLQELERHRSRGMDRAYGILWAMPGDDGRASEPVYSATTVSALEARVSALTDALRQLADGCYAEFCGVGTEAFEPDDAKVSYPEDRCQITFGMIRNARKVLKGASP